MGHYVKDNVGTERKSGQSCPDGGQQVHNSGQKVSLELRLAGAQGVQWIQVIGACSQSYENMRH